jgi:quercetin 2,3-dioxygenase
MEAGHAQTETQTPTQTRRRKEATSAQACTAAGAPARSQPQGAAASTTSMKAADIMSAPVISVPPEASGREIAGLLSERRISAVPVLEGERLVGLISESDLLRRRALGAMSRRARDLMTSEVVTVAPETPVEEIAALLQERAIKRVPVMQAGRVVGIVSRSNLVQALAVKALPQALHPEEDEAIRTLVLSRLEGSRGWRPAESKVMVDDGVVHYWGPAGSEQERAAARAAAERIPGVRRVEDHRVRAPRRPAAGAPQVRPASERGYSKQGWMESYHSFTFGNYYDPSYTGYGPLQAVNENLIQAGKGSTTYGLRDIEVITYVLDGALAHEDTLDHSAILRAGSVQCVSAGSGVRFQEANCSPSAPSHFLQMWLEPDRIGLPASSACRHFPEEAKRGRLQLIVSSDAREGSLLMRQDALIYVGSFDGTQRAQLEILPNRLAYTHISRGAITVQGRQLGPGDGLASAGGILVLERGRNAEVLVFDLPDAAPAAAISAR